MSEDNNYYVNNNKKSNNHKKPLENKKFADDDSDDDINGNNFDGNINNAITFKMNSPNKTPINQLKIEQPMKKIELTEEQLKKIEENRKNAYTIRKIKTN